MGHSEACLPWWAQDGLGCPYGIHLGGDVTLPLRIGGFGRDPSVLDFVAVVYSFLPFVVVPVALACAVFCRPRTTQVVSFVGFTATVFFFNEAFVKKLALQPRPGALRPLDSDPFALGISAFPMEGSCAKTCGMPSSHSTVSVGWFVVMMLNAVHRVASDSEMAGAARKLGCFRRLCDLSTGNFVALSRATVVAYVSIWALILLPIPFARVALQDHTWQQVAVGGALGATYAALWYYLGPRVCSCARRSKRCGPMVEAVARRLDLVYMAREQPLLLTLGGPSTPKGAKAGEMERGMGSAAAGASGYRPGVEVTCQPPCAPNCYRRVVGQAEQ